MNIRNIVLSRYADCFNCWDLGLYLCAAQTWRGIQFSLCCSKHKRKVTFVQIKTNKTQTICIVRYQCVYTWEDIFFYDLGEMILYDITSLAHTHARTTKWWHFSLLNRKPFCQTHREEQAQMQQHKKRGRQWVGGSLKVSFKKNMLYTNIELMYLLKVKNIYINSVCTLH